MANRRAIKTKRANKRGGYVVKGVTKKHWWHGGYSPEWDFNSSRAQLKRDTRREIEEAIRGTGRHE